MPIRQFAHVYTARKDVYIVVEGDTFGDCFDYLCDYMFREFNAVYTDEDDNRLYFKDYLTIYVVEVY